MAKILIIDIETAPKLAYVWRFFKTNVGAKMVKEHGHTLSFAAKWLGSDEVLYRENRTSDDKEIVQEMVNLLDAADIVIAHNAKRFDLPSINGRALVHGIAPPSPYKVVDTLIAARNYFKFESNSLEYLAIALGCEEKESHKNFPGFELWLECLRQNEDAWAEMKTYNIQDVTTLEEIYLKMRPWITNHPNVAILQESDELICGKCGSHHIHFRGYTTTNAGKYRKFQCQDCGGWGRSRYTEYPKDKRKSLITNA